MLNQEIEELHATLNRLRKAAQLAPVLRAGATKPSLQIEINRARQGKFPPGDKPRDNRLY